VHGEIKGVLERSAAAWSAGDLDTFMACYEDSPDTIYLTATQIVSGYADIRSMYAGRFGAEDGKSMGDLTVKLLRVTRVGSEHVLAVGVYSLQGVEVSAGGQHTGMCSLVLHNTANGWRICADHTS
jgi:ketosteroid isomerase-like protein